MFDCQHVEKWKSLRQWHAIRPRRLHMLHLWGICLLLLQCSLSNVNISM